MDQNEKYIVQITCTQCSKRLKISKPLGLDVFKEKWGQIYSLAPKVAAMVQKDSLCPCFDGTTGKGAASRVSVWACEGMHFCDVIMRNPQWNDFSIIKITKGIQVPTRKEIEAVNAWKHEGKIIKK